MKVPRVPCAIGLAGLLLLSSVPSQGQAPRAGRSDLSSGDSFLMIDMRVDCFSLDASSRREAHSPR